MTTEHQVIAPLTITYTTIDGLTGVANLVGAVSGTDHYVAADRQADARVVVEITGNEGWREVLTERADFPVNIVPMDSSDASEMGDLVGPFWSEIKVVETLDLPSLDALDERRNVGSILAMTDDSGERFYPVSQFHKRDDVVEVRPLLADFFQVMKSREPWTIGVVMHTPAPELNDVTPLAWARGNLDRETLLDYGRRLAHQWAH